MEPLEARLTSLEKQIDQCHTESRLIEVEAMYKRSPKELGKVLASDHLRWFAGINSLRYIYYLHDRPEDIEDLHQQVREGHLGAAGSYNIKALTAIGDMGRTHHERGDLKDAENAYQSALKGFEFALGRYHQLTLETVRALAEVYTDQGRFSDAEPLYWRALEESENQLGRNARLTLFTANQLGSLYTAQGKLVEAEAIFLRALRGSEQRLGPYHYRTLRILANVGILYKKQGKLAEAEAAYKRVIYGYEKMLRLESLDHTSTLEVVNNLGELYDEQNLRMKRELQSRKRSLGSRLLCFPHAKKKRSSTGGDRTETTSTCSSEMVFAGPGWDQK